MPPSANTSATATCRFCASALEHVFADLGSTPLANAFLLPELAREPEPRHRLLARVCERCLLVQLEEFASPQELFSDYAYLSSYSTTWLDHARRYAEQMTDQLGLGADHRVIEIASNDGYLLRHFRDLGVPVLGVEPAANAAALAIADGIPTRVEFFGARTASALREETAADLLVANNVLAHVPDINDFVQGCRILLAPAGTITAEFPHLLALIEQLQWDTIYHEHLSYLSFTTICAVFDAHGLRCFDVEVLPSHGGSLRVFVAHAGDARAQTVRARAMLEQERTAGLLELATYVRFGERIAADRCQIRDFIAGLRGRGLRIAGYGAAAKGNTMLNHCAIGPECVEFVCDRSPRKQGRLLPGSRIPVRAPDAIANERPEVVLILAWNLREEIIAQLSFIREWGGRFAARAPEMRLLA